MNHGWTYADRIAYADAGETIEGYYAGRYRHSPAEEWEARIGRGEIERNDRPATLGERLAEGDLLRWHRPPWEEPAVPRDFKIVREDPSFVAVDKPAGLPVLPDGGFLENTLVHLLSERYPGEKLVPAHRLGRGTSGLILFSRTEEARRDLAAQFRDKTARADGTLRKTYVARSLPAEGRRVGDEIEITTPIGPVPHPVLGRIFAATPDGRPALSRCRIIESAPGSTLWEIDLVTGRPHQIRIHLASIGCPLLGDPLFLPGGHPRPDALPGDCGYYLRATALAFRHPAGGEPVRIEVAR